MKLLFVLGLIFSYSAYGTGSESLDCSKITNAEIENIVASNLDKEITALVNLCEDQLTDYEMLYKKATVGEDKKLRHRYLSKIESISRIRAELSVAFAEKAISQADRILEKYK